MAYRKQIKTDETALLRRIADEVWIFFFEICKFHNVLVLLGEGFYFKLLW
jgi:hypothetical protein